MVDQEIIVDGAPATLPPPSSATANGGVNVVGQSSSMDEDDYLGEIVEPEKPSNNNMINTATTKIDLSAAAYSLKKNAELEAIRLSKKQHDSVRSIIASLDERGIGRVSLNGVQVEAFIHKMQEEHRLPRGREAYKLAVALAQESGGAGMNSFKRVHSEGSSASGGSPSKSLENYLQQAFETARGMHVSDTAGHMDHAHNKSNDSAVIDAKLAAEMREKVIRESDDAIAATAQLLDAAGGEVPKFSKGGVYREHVPKKDSSADSKSKQRQQQRHVGHATNSSSYSNGTGYDANEIEHHNTEDLIARYQTNGPDRGVDVNTLNEHAYKMNASKNVPYKKLVNAGMGYSDELAPQKELDECVEGLAKIQRERMKPGVEGEVYVPQRDEAEVEYEKRLKARMIDRKSKAGSSSAVYHPPPTREGALFVDSPDRYESQMRNNKSRGRGGNDAGGTGHSGPNEEEEVTPHEWHTSAVVANIIEEESVAANVAEKFNLSKPQDINDKGEAERLAAEEATILAELLGNVESKGAGEAGADTKEDEVDDGLADGQNDEQTAADQTERDDLSEEKVVEVDQKKEQEEEQSAAVEEIEESSEKPPEQKVKSEKKVSPVDNPDPMAEARKMEEEMQEMAKKQCCVIL